MEISQTIEILKTEKYFILSWII